MPLSELIDKITNSIEEASNSDSIETIVLPLAKHDPTRITKSKGWNFSWRKEFIAAHKIVYKLVTKIQPQVIQGLISISVEEGFIFMHLIESAPHNIGKRKRYLGVPGNLVAFVCKLAFEYGYNGEVAFDSKTALIDHYNKTLGAVLIFPPKRMAILSEEAQKLVNSYYKNFEI